MQIFRSLKTVSQGRGGFELSISYAGFLDRGGNTTKDAVFALNFKLLFIVTVRI
jgi:hypothetical protein